MNKQDTIILTLPIKPQQETNIGMMISPTIMDYIGSSLSIKKNIGFNTIHSYENKDVNLNSYLSYVNNSGINYDSVFIDKNYSDELLNIIEKMYYDGFIKVKTKETIRCECGRVDMLCESINNEKLYTRQNGKIICNHCGKECKKYQEKSLVLEIRDETIIPSICPLFLEKEMKELSKNFKNSDILISKGRNTGFEIDTREGIFNIDVDFIWSNYFNLMQEQNQIYIASNHQLFAMYFMNYLAAISSNKSLSFIANPYLNMDLKNAKNQYEKKLLKEYKALLILYNLRWHNKNCNWSDSVASYLNGISETKIKNLYKSMILNASELINPDTKIEEILYILLNYNTNMQNNIKIMKKMYKGGLL